LEALRPLALKGLSGKEGPFRPRAFKALIGHGRLRPLKALKSPRGPCRP